MMSGTGRVLLAGGSGLVGRATAKWFAERHPDVPLLVGGRRIDAAREVAASLPSAEAVTIDLDQPDLGLDAAHELAAVMVLAPEPGLNGLRLALSSGIPYLNIGLGLPEVGPETALLAHRPPRAPVVIASHWMGGSAAILATRAARDFDKAETVRFETVYDPEDPAGPGALEDMERVHKTSPGNLAFRDGRRVWLAGEDAEARVTALDGRALEATAFSSFDIASLAASTGARDVRFDLATEISSSRRRGEEAAIEIAVEIEGQRGGEAKRSRSTLEFVGGQAQLTGLAAALALSRLLGLEGGEAPSAGLYMPEQLADPDWFLGAIRASGGRISLG